MFGPRWALKAINGWNADVVQGHLLRICPRQRLMFLESEDRGVPGSGLTWSKDTSPVHPVHEEWHSQQRAPPVSKVIGDVGAGGTRLHVHDLHILIVRLCVADLLRPSYAFARSLPQYSAPSVASLLPLRLRD